MSPILVALLLVSFVTDADASEHSRRTSYNDSSSTCDSPSRHNEYTYSYRPIDSEFVVTFEGHYAAQRRGQILAPFLDAILGPDSWSVVPRSGDNPFANLPTDFDVIKVLAPNVSSLLDAFDGPWPGVKSIVPQVRITRKLMTGYHPETDDPTTADEYKNDADYDVHGSRQSAPTRKRLSLSYFWPSHRSKNKRLLGTYAKQVTSLLGADLLWKLGVTGKGVRVGVFDTGIASPHHPAFDHVADVTDWTFESSGERASPDTLGHGTFVCGVIAGRSPDCPGFAPDAELYVFRVFTDGQISYTSWYLDAFNYAILKKIHILNLSIGGPDFLDRPFIDKVWELSANRMIMISSIGNDGPIAGSLNNPADMIDVIGVGGITHDDKLASFSSRGMTTWELPAGYGRVKPDILTYGIVQGPGLNGGCRVLSGTSVASPVVAGAVALLLSSILDEAPVSTAATVANGAPPRLPEIPAHFNVALLKQVLMAGATRLPGLSMFDQGHGKMDLLKSYQILRSYQAPRRQSKMAPVVSLDPAYLDAAGPTECPYMWPYCSQPLYHTAMPLVVNVTILNPTGLTGRIVDKPTWHPYLRENGKYLEVHISHSPLLWPWSGWLAVHVTVHKNAPAQWEGVAAGQINLTVRSPPTVRSVFSGDDDVTPPAPIVTSLVFPIRVKVIRKPAPEKRVLWDQFHNLNYPPGYCPRDNLLLKDDPMDWNGDHLHTNFRALYNHLRRSGYFIEALGGPLTCFEASNYGTVLMVDPEEEYWPEERAKLYADVANGLSMVLLADWYNTTVMRKIKFYDENTRHWWIPDTGGSNVPALNELLQPWNISLGDRVYEGEFSIGPNLVSYVSGTSLTNFPEDPSAVVIAPTLKDQGHSVITESRYTKVERAVPILGMYQTKTADFPNTPSASIHPNARSSPSPGRIVVYGDSNCVDSQRLTRDCFWLMDDFLTYAMTGHLSPTLRSNSDSIKFNNGTAAASSAPAGDETRVAAKVPAPPVPRLPGNKLFRYSKVLSQQTNAQTFPDAVQHPHKNLLNETLARSSTVYVDEGLAPDQTYLDRRPMPVCPFPFTSGPQALPPQKGEDSLTPYKLVQGRPMEFKFVHHLSKIHSFGSFLSGHMDAEALAAAQEEIRIASRALDEFDHDRGQNPHPERDGPSGQERPDDEPSTEQLFARQSYQREVLSSLAIFLIALVIIILSVAGVRTLVLPLGKTSRKVTKMAVTSPECKKKTSPPNKSKNGGRRSHASNNQPAPPSHPIPYKSIK